jgi:bacillolysin
MRQFERVVGGGMAVMLLCVTGAQRSAAQNDRLDRVRVNPLARAATTSATVRTSSDPADALTAALAERLRTRLARRNTRGAAPAARAAKGQAAAQSSAGDADQLEVHLRPGVGTPMQIRVPASKRARRTATRSDSDPVHTAGAFLRDHRGLLRLDDPDAELSLHKNERDQLGRRHLRYTQTYQGLPVWPADLIVHLDPNGNVALMDGAFVPTPHGVSIQPLLDANAAVERARAAVPGGADASASAPQLIVYAPGDRPPRLAWKLELSVALNAHWLVVIDAIDGSVARAFNLVADAGVTGSGIDVLGQRQTLHVFEDAGLFYMADTSKPMFDPTSPAPTLDTRGGILILDALNGDPNDPNFQLVQVTSPDSNAWNPADAVSAATNIALTYDYYLDRHNRNSIDGEGGSLLGIVRFRQGFNNAFWNGTFMVFGDAQPFAGALDVVGHELTHGVTQFTANLIYQDQSGAMNEAMSDIFGEAVEARAVGAADFLDGAILSNPRNIADPESVRICTGCPTYPAKMSEFIGPDDPFFDRFVNRDNNGVHINSTIISHAFYLLAEGLDDALGIRDAERIFYRALTTHLVANSIFIDARLATIAAAEEIFGQGSRQALVTAEAFDAVEIFAGRGTPQPSPFPPVAGQDALLFLFFDNDAQAYFLGRRESGFGDPSDGVQLADGSLDGSRPSVAGDGSFAAFVSGDNDVCLINTDGTQVDPDIVTTEDCLGFPQFIYSVAVAPNGQRFGFVLLDSNGDPDNKISVIDLDPDGTTRTFTLRAPTLDADTTDTILNADVMDFTADGRFLVYDALNQLQVAGGAPVQTWSIFALDLDTETTQTIVPPTTRMDIGNPALSQTSDNFVTFDVADRDTGTFNVFAANLTTGARGLVATVINGSGVPGYTGDDSAIVYSQSDDSPTEFSLLRQPLAADHITPNGPAVPVLANADFGVIYRRGAFLGPPPGCVGDCNGNGTVSIDDVLSLVNIALGTARATCTAGDANGDGQITIDEILMAVNAALIGCS